MRTVCADELRVALVMPRIDVLSGAMERTLRLLDLGQAARVDYSVFLPPGGLPNREATARLRDLERAGRITIHTLSRGHRGNGRERFDAVTIPTEYWWGAWKRARAGGLEGPFAFEFHLLPYIGGLDVLKSIGIEDPGAIDLVRMPFLIRQFYADGLAPSALQTAASAMSVRAFARLRHGSALAISPVVAKQLAAMGYDRGMYVPECPNGVDREAVEHAIRADRTFEYDAIYVGRFHPQKGFLDLPLVVHRLKGLLGRDVRVAVCGHPDATRHMIHFNRLVRSLGIEYDLVFLGHVSRDSLYRKIRQSRMLLYPSYVDSFSLTILETLCLGVPVVAYAIDAVEMIWANREAVYRAPVGQPDAIARIAASLCDDSTGETARRAAERQAPDLLREYSWRNAVQDERKFYEHVAAGRLGGRGIDPIAGRLPT